MSTSSRSSAADTLAAALAVWFAVAATMPAAAADARRAPALPVAVAELAPDLRVQGGGELRFLGMTVYDSYYWAGARGHSTAEPFALDLHYRRALNGERIAERSIHEIERAGGAGVAELARWGAAMKAIFPDVGKGDRLTGVNLPGRGVRFFHNGKPIGEIAEPTFARAFFGIWLDPGTSQPELRRRLLGERPIP